MEHLNMEGEPENIAEEEAEDVPEAQKEPEAQAAVAETKTTDTKEEPVPVHAVAPLDSAIVDEESYALGLVVSEHSSGTTYARFVRPKVAPPGSALDVARERSGRDRLRRMVPTSFTYGGYRSTTGQASTFSFN